MDRPDGDVSHLGANLNFDLHHAAAQARRLPLEVQVLAKQSDEFTALRCYLAAHRSQQSSQPDGRLPTRCPSASRFGI